MCVFIFFCSSGGLAFFLPRKLVVLCCDDCLFSSEFILNARSAYTKSRRKESTTLSSYFASLYYMNRSCWWGYCWNSYWNIGCPSVIGSCCIFWIFPQEEDAERGTFSTRFYCALFSKWEGYSLFYLHYFQNLRSSTYTGVRSYLIVLLNIYVTEITSFTLSILVTYPSFLLTVCDQYHFERSCS